MRALPPSTAVERIAGSLPVEATATVVAALAGGLLAPILPVLAKSLASERQKKRVESYLDSVSQVLEQHEAALIDLTDAQYNLINEAILASLHTTQSEKLKILRNVVRNSLHLDGIQPQEAILLSRIIRDISAEEVLFVVRNFAYDSVQVAREGTRSDDKTLIVYPDTLEALIVSGLLSLGVLTPGLPTLGQSLCFSRIVAKLIVLLKNDDA